MKRKKKIYVPKSKVDNCLSMRRFPRFMSPGQEKKTNHAVAWKGTGDRLIPYDI